MNKKPIIAGTLPALLVTCSLAPLGASAAIIQLTATGTIAPGDGSTIHNGSVPVTVPTGTALVITYLIDTDTFPTGAAGAGGATIYNPAGVSGCTSTNLPQNPLQASFIGATVSVGGVMLQTQNAGNVLNCDSVLMNADSGQGDYLQIEQNAYDSQTVYYTDGDLNTVSPTPTPYYIQEDRRQNLWQKGAFVNDPFSTDELLSDLAQTFTLDSFYGTQFFTEFGRGRYICSAPGCFNEPTADGGHYILYGYITGVAGTVVPAPATLGLLATAFVGLARRTRRRRSPETV
jgi:hypothetical protein